MSEPEKIHISEANQDESNTVFLHNSHLWLLTAREELQQGPKPVIPAPTNGFPPPKTEEMAPARLFLLHLFFVKNWLNQYCLLRCQGVYPHAH
ncbi:hypothetical protein GRJ2_000395800 [Grus japonensis]|uniref:Uncharacterized protein n=1 Tax=Grus japonensis TaxID=30415 RepID=A0ABC9W111_GRUJA